MSEKSEVTKAVTKAPASGLIPNTSTIYNTDGDLLIYRGADSWEKETDNEFLTRFQTGKNVSMRDMDRVCELHPIVLALEKQGLKYREAMHGISEGEKYKNLFPRTGFGRWSTFRTHTAYLCPGLKVLFETALEIRETVFLEDAEAELRRRAIDGVQEEVYSASGKFAGTRTKYSDKLLELQLKALDPDKYSDKKQVSVKGTVVQINMGLRNKPFTKEINAEVEELIDD